MLKIAVTGSAGTGKSNVCRKFEGLGVQVISADTLAREAVVQGTPAYLAILEYFGEDAVCDDGILNRSFLRQKMIQQPECQKLLEDIIHPEVVKRMQELFENAEIHGSAMIVAEVPLLFEAGLDRFFDVIILVMVDRKLQTQRLMHRDRVSLGEAEKLIHIQLPDIEKRKYADFIIDNNDSPEQLLQKTNDVYNKICQKYSIPCKFA